MEGILFDDCLLITGRLTPSTEHLHWMHYKKISRNWNFLIGLLIWRIYKGVRQGCSGVCHSLVTCSFCVWVGQSFPCMRWSYLCLYELPCTCIKICHFTCMIIMLFGFLCYTLYWSACNIFDFIKGNKTSVFLY